MGSRYRNSRVIRKNVEGDEVLIGNLKFLVGKLM